MTGAERHLAARVLSALLREDYGGLASRMTRDKDGVRLALASGRAVRLAPGLLYQDFVCAPEDGLTLGEVLGTLAEVAGPQDSGGVAAFGEECRAALRGHEWLDARRDEVLTRLARLWNGAGRPGASGGDMASTADPGTRGGADAGGGAGSRDDAGSGDGERSIVYESLAAFAEHPVYPTSRARLGLAEADAVAFAPEFAPAFRLHWARVPRERVTGAGDPPGAWPRHPPRSDPSGAWPSEPLDAWPSGPSDGWPSDPAYALFPVHPLTVPVVSGIPGVTVFDRPYLTARPTLSMRTVQVGPRTHLKLPLPISTLGARNRRSIKPGTLGDGARAELLLREVLRREPDLDVVLADEQTYAHAGHEYLGWMARRLPAGEIVPVAALLAPSPLTGVPSPELAVLSPVVDHAHARPPVPRVLDHVAARHAGGDVAGLLAGYLRLLFAWNVRLLVTYGIALEAHQQNLALVFTEPGTPPRLLVKDNDGILASPDRLRAAGLAVPRFTDPRVLTDDPHALADVFVTITLHLAAAAVAFGAGYGELVADALEQALAEHRGHPMARLLRARTLDAARLVGKSMVTAGTLADRGRVAADVNKHYGTSGPNYLRHHHRRKASQ
ncbi:IucA/IucC family protein [Sphaerisporangium sp. NPDC051017]|uniref:IucA/IucC family protein n=1 Tax=Sphaerisporangium sp. NPDC051017 TaxID=3154636 RepID=UPI00343B3039